MPNHVGYFQVVQIYQRQKQQFPSQILLFINKLGSSAMRDIEITQLGNPFNSRYRPQTDPFNSRYRPQTDSRGLINYSQTVKPNLLRELSSNDTHAKSIVPIKEYSNKFLRQSGSIQGGRDGYPGLGRGLNSIASKQKHFHKKYQKITKKPHQVCKTQPNQNECPCSSSSKNFYQQEKLPVRIKTENMVERQQNSHQIALECDNQQSFQRSYCNKSKNGNFCHSNPQNAKGKEYNAKGKEYNAKGKEGASFTKKDDKISTSRALQFFSRIVSKDRGDLIQKLKICNQKKIFKEKLMESSKNLQAKQMTLLHKTKKFSMIQRGQRRSSIKTAIKQRNRKCSAMPKTYKEDQNYEIKGWDFPY